MTRLKGAEFSIVPPVTDEELMIYADGDPDGMLSADDRVRIQHLIATEPAVRARYEVFRATGRVVGDPFTFILNEPLPQRLVDIPLEAGREQGQHAPRGRPAPGSLDALRQWMQAGWGPAVALGAIVSGVAIGWLLRDADVLRPGARDRLYAMRSGQLVARGELAMQLETARSRSKIALASPDASNVTIGATFLSRRNTYCREYRIERPDNSWHTEFACRSEDGTWQIEFKGPTLTGTAPPPETQLSGDKWKDALDTFLRGMSKGDTFDRDMEDSVLMRGWRKER